MNTPILILLGPTASGKTDLAIPLSQVVDGEIISADSMQIYRGMDIGTAKPDMSTRRLVPHHLIDIRDPWEGFNACLFVEEAAKKIADIQLRGKTVLIVGGTALYIKSLLEGIFPGPSANWEIRRVLSGYSPGDLYQRLCQLDPNTAQRLSPNDTRRVIRALEVVYATGIPISEYQRHYTHPPGAYRPCFIGINWPKPILHQRIASRVEQMLHRGLVEETEGLLVLPHPLSHTAAQAIGYREAIDALAHPEKFSCLKESIELGTKQFAKRQMTWLRRFPVHWLSAASSTEMLQECLDIWNSFLKHV